MLLDLAMAAISLASNSQAASGPSQPPYAAPLTPFRPMCMDWDLGVDDRAFFLGMMIPLGASHEACGLVGPVFRASLQQSTFSAPRIRHVNVNIASPWATRPAPRNSFHCNADVRLR